MIEWISVQDELPLTNQLVLVCADKMEPTFRKDRKVEKHNEIFIDYMREYPKDNKFWSKYEYYTITHWMPLPEPPTE